MQISLAHLDRLSWRSISLQALCRTRRAIEKRSTNTTRLVKVIIHEGSCRAHGKDSLLDWWAFTDSCRALAPKILLCEEISTQHNFCEWKIPAHSLPEPSYLSVLILKSSIEMI